MSDMSEKKGTLPSSIGVVMDGNRRWAKERNLPSLLGHRRGYGKIKDFLEWCREFGIPHVALYAFSTENWNRTEEEVRYLMDIFREGIEEFFQAALKNETRLFFCGEKYRCPPDIQEAMDKAELQTAHFSVRTLALMLSYGGRAEILDAVHRIPKENISSIDEEEFSSLLWTSSFPDPDIIIRTGGEKRLSGFLTWKSVYSELFFIDEYWPDFSKETFSSILQEYAERERRFGT